VTSASLLLNAEHDFVTDSVVLEKDSTSADIVRSTSANLILLLFYLCIIFFITISFFIRICQFEFLCTCLKSGLRLMYSTPSNCSGVISEENSVVELCELE